MKMRNKIWFIGSFKWTQSIPFHGVDGIGTRAEMRPDGVAFYANLFCHVMMSMSNATSWQDCYFRHLSTVDSCVLLERCWVLLRSFGPPFQLSPGQISKWSVTSWNLILVWISCKLQHYVSYKSYVTSLKLEIALRPKPFPSMSSICVFQALRVYQERDFLYSQFKSITLASILIVFLKLQ